MAGFFDKLFGGGATEEGTQKGIAERQAQFGGAKTYLEGATDKASGYYDRAYAEFDPLLGGSQQGANAYADAMGLNGPEGLARAKATFEAMPGYGGALTSSNDEILKRMALTGNLASSNTLQGISDNTANVINQKYGSYTSGLLPYLQQGQNVAGMRAGILTGQGGLYGNLGTNVGNWQTQLGNQNAESYLKGGMAQDQGAMNLFTGILGALTGGGKLATAPISPTSALGRFIG